MRNEVQKVRDYIPIIFNGGYKQIRIVSSGGYWQYYDRGSDIPDYYFDLEILDILAKNEETKILTIYLK